MKAPLNFHFDPVMFVVRGYPGPIPEKPGPGFDLVISIFVLGDGRARAFAAHGEMSASTVRALAGELKARGIHTLLVNRQGVEQEWKTATGSARIFDKETS